MAKQLKRLLVVSWALPPLLTARSLQVGRLLDALARKGWKIDVVCVDAKSVHPAQVDPGSSQYNKHLNVHPIPEPLTKLPQKFLAKFFPSMLPLPDPSDMWVKRATVEGLRLIRKKNYHSLLSFGQPWESHIVGLNLKKSSRLPWLAHFSDPWVDNPYLQNLTTGQQAKIVEQERNVIALADKIIFTNKPAAVMEMRKYPTIWNKKVYILPHAFDRKAIGRPIKQIRKSDRMKFVFTGNLYGLRNPRNLILSLRGLSNLTLEFAGLVKDVETYKQLAKNVGVGEMVKFTGQLSYKGSLKLAAEADVLLLIDAPSEKSLFLPSKLIDYLMFEKPILGITPKKGAAADLLHELGYPVVAPDDVGEITAAMRKLIKQWQSNRLKTSTKHRKVAQRYEIGHVSREFDTLINSVSH